MLERALRGRSELLWLNVTFIFDPELTKLIAPTYRYGVASGASVVDRIRCTTFQSRMNKLGLGRLLYRNAEAAPAKSGNHTIPFRLSRDFITHLGLRA